jgi:hypothetical protein
MIIIDKYIKNDINQNSNDDILSSNFLSNINSSDRFNENDD